MWAYEDPWELFPLFGIRQVHQLAYSDFLMSHLIAWEGCMEKQCKKSWILAESKGNKQKTQIFWLDAILENAIFNLQVLWCSVWASDRLLLYN